MAQNPLRLAIRQAARDNRALQKLFWRAIGTGAHPRGAALVAYRNARRAMASVLAEGADTRYRAAAANEVLVTLQRRLGEIGYEALGEAAEIGRGSAGEQVAGYEAAGMRVEVAGELADLGPLLDGFGGVVEGQLRAVYSLVAAGAGAERVIGDKTRLGALQPGPVTRGLAQGLTLAREKGLALWLVGRDGRLITEETLFRRQAIAAVDHLTTDCCLRVHGQVVGLDEDFRLTGTPRYADRLRGAPFHDWCRTSVALYQEAYDDGLTAELRGSAKAELSARANAQTNIDRLKQELADLGQYPNVRIRKDDTEKMKKLRNELRIWRARLREEIWPSHARSRRNYKEPFVG